MLELKVLVGKVASADRGDGAGAVAIDEVAGFNQAVLLRDRWRTINNLLDSTFLIRRQIIKKAVNCISFWHICYSTCSALIMKSKVKRACGGVDTEYTL